jgi:hypothetical protein
MFTTKLSFWHVYKKINLLSTAFFFPTDRKLLKGAGNTDHLPLFGKVMGRTPPAEALFQGRGAGRSDECIEGGGGGPHTWETGNL